MLKSVSSRVMVAVLLAVGMTGVRAQSPGYHLELRQMPSGVRVAFVNDGPRSIDAYEIYRDCGPDDPQWMFRTLYGDYLSFNPAYWAGLSVLPAGDSWVTPLVDRGPTCQPSVKAVIFSDGTAEGDPVSLALIQAARDGYSDEVSFWAERLGLENSVAPRWEELLAEANARQSVAHSMSFRRNLSEQARAYWSARDCVAAYTRTGFEPASLKQFDSERKRNAWFEGMRSGLVDWKHTIDQAQTRTMLAAKYPLPAEVREGAKTAFVAASSVPSGSR